MRFRKCGGYLTLEAMLCFYCTVLAVTIAVTDFTTTNHFRRHWQKEELEWQSTEATWWQESNGGCRDTCLLDMVILP